MAADTIETLDDWNTRLAACDCCAMPLCPVPVKECQSLPGRGYPAGQEDNYGHPCKEIRLDYGQGGWIRYRSSSFVAAYLGIGGVKVTPEVTITMTHGGILLGGYTTTYVDIITPEESQAAAYAAMLAALDWNNAQMRKGDDCAALRDNLPWNPWLSQSLAVTFVRYRWRIPDSFKGKWFKITWDEVFFPMDFEEGNPDSPQPSAVNRDMTVEWEGPGDQTKPDSWIAGDWHVVNPPPEDGETRVVNVRYQCYRSPKFGNKPQVTGESFDLAPDPAP